MDPGDPAGVVVDLVGRACRLVRDLIAGAMVERDFRDEFLTYWRYDKNINDSRLTSILAAQGPSREVCIWQAPNIRLIGETEGEVRRWLGNRFGPQALRRPYAQRAMMIWLDEPMLPYEYPRTARDLLMLAESAGPDVSALLSDIALARQENLTTVIGAVGRFGPGLVTVTVPSPGRGKLRHGVCSEPVDRGFRPSHLPLGLLINRTFGIEPVYRSEPARADAAWIHGRGQDSRSARLKRATVTLLGCGSVGAPIAVALAQAGVGRIKLVDHDELAWANVGRHPLGATAVGRNKAVSLAAKLQSDYPHGNYEAFPVHAAAFLNDVEGNWLGSDLIISAMGSWLAEAQLNDLHCLHGRPMPAIYTWTESNAAAGHAVVVAGRGGCLRCGIGRTGVPAFQVTSWPDGGSGALEEPACGAHYQAYGPIELGFVTALTGQTALDALLGRITASQHRMYVTRRTLLEDVRGRWSDDFVAEYPAYIQGGCTLERDWPADACPGCRQSD
ncbi:hypothetical protein CFIICLFH_4781 [Methylobacterium goesingense]|nr:hypothetical protein CFIICLFH_4781 [Methylobacterium goesingense]